LSFVKKKKITDKDDEKQPLATGPRQIKAFAKTPVFETELRLLIFLSLI